jgi:purine-binding chemotaxis protein CheW
MGKDRITEVVQHLTFKLDEEVFAINISKIREVLEFITITKVPRTPDFMCGVINLRGGVVPVIDLRIKFGIEVAERTVDTCIIIVEVTLEGETTLIGALVDSVQEVSEFESGQIEPAPRIGTRLNTEFIEGMGKRDNEFIMILDMDRVFSSDELSAIQNADIHVPSQEPASGPTQCAPDNALS